MNELTDRLRRDFEEWKRENPSLAGRQHYEARLKKLMEKAQALVPSLPENKDKEEFLQVLGSVQRMYQAFESFPLDPGSSATLGAAEDLRAYNLAEYLRTKGVDASVRARSTRVRTGIFSVETIRTGLVVGNPRIRNKKF